MDIYYSSHAAHLHGLIWTVIVLRLHKGAFCDLNCLLFFSTRNIDFLFNKKSIFLVEKKKKKKSFLFMAAARKCAFDIGLLN